MSPPATTTPAAEKKTSRKKRPRQRSRQLNGVPTLDEETGQYTLQVRTPRAQRGSKTLVLRLSEPAADEECSITLEPMREYRLPFVPEEEAQNCVVVGEPALTKASLPCGHGFHALALLYHFAKNSMTCPICRAGHAKAQITEQSVPFHMRKHFAAHLASLRAEESNEQIAADAVAAARMLELEVSRLNNSGFMPMTRVVLILYVFDTMELWRRDLPGQPLVEPILALELPLTSSLNLGILEFESSGYSLGQLNLNLLRLPSRPAAFEVGVGVQSLLHGSMLLFRTVRFPSTGAMHRVVFARNSLPNEPLAIEVLTMAGVEGLNTFHRLRWAVPVSSFSNMLLLSVTRNMQEEEGAQIAAV